LSHYKITAKLGEGGMGEVYRARDTQLDREVAIKVLPEAFTTDPERLARFEREAKVLASLNHPNISSIYGLEKIDDKQFLVLELVEGETLAERIATGPVPIDEALELGRQLTEGLAAAHERGIVHRDLKPANIMVTPEGQIKILDFGLAKSWEAAGSDLDLSQSPTLTGQMTVQGVILGTASYMSPEQARGQETDKRTDIWAFGAVLWEMLTGEQLFAGTTVTDVLASILKTEFDWDLLPKDIPSQVKRVLHRCLERDAKNRLHDIADARLDIEEAQSSPQSESVAPTASPTSAPGSLRPAIALLLGALLASAGWWALSGKAGGDQGALVKRLSLQMPEGLYPESVRVSPDGAAVAIRAVARPGSSKPKGRLVVRRMESEAAQTVPGSAGVLAFAFSPDGNWLAFVAPIAEESSVTRIFKVPTDGRTPPLAVVDMDPNWNSSNIVWLPDGNLVLMTRASPKQLVTIPMAGGVPPGLVALSANVDGDIDVYSVLTDSAVLGERDSWQGGYRVDAVIIDTKTGEVTELANDAASPKLSSSGHLVFSRHDKLLAAPIDLTGRKLLSGPISITAGVRSDAYNYRSLFDLGADGTLVYLPGGEVGGKRRLIVIDGDSRSPWSTDELRVAPNTSIDASTNGQWLALTLMNEKGLYEVWGSEIARPALRRLVSFPTLDCSNPHWSYDGDLLVVRCTGAGDRQGIYVLEMTATSEPELIFEVQAGKQRPEPLSISPSRLEILFREGSGEETGVLVLPLDGEKPAEPQTLLQGRGSIQSATLSKDGSKLAYVSNESGRFEVFLRGRALAGGLGPAVPVSTGLKVEWGSSGAGKELLYIWTPDQRVIAVSVREDLSVTVPVLVHDLSAIEPNQVIWDLLPGGKLISVMRGEDEQPPESINVVLNFNSELERLAPRRQ
ncbi:MAG: protein kinase, partial [Thermoanaerobaculia bacterium]